LTHGALELTRWSRYLAIFNCSPVYWAVERPEAPSRSNWPHV